MTVLSTTQMTLNFDAGISSQSDSLKEFIREEAIPALWQKRGLPKKHVAADMDLSPSELTRKLSDNPNDPRNFSTDDLELYLEKTEDLTPVFYLLDKYGKKKQDEIEVLKARLAELTGEKL